MGATITTLIGFTIINCTCTIATVYCAWLVVSVGKSIVEVARDFSVDAAKLAKHSESVLAAIEDVQREISSEVPHVNR